MTFLNSPIFNVFLGFASYMLGLSILVQIVQEMFKYLTSSKSKAYSKALNDFLGPWAFQLLKGNFNLIARGPFQWMRLKPTGNVQPLEKDQLIKGLEKTAPYWVKKTFGQIKQEIAYKGEKPKEPSPSWNEFLEELGQAEKGTSGYWNALDITKWLKQKGHDWNDKPNKKTLGPISYKDAIDAADLLVSFKTKFLPHVQDASEQFPQFQKNFDFTYKRRNLRQTFTFAMIIALAFQLNIGRIYNSVTKMTVEEVSALAENVQNINEELKTEWKEIIDKVKDQVLRTMEEPTQEILIQNISKNWEKKEGKFNIPLALKYLFECLVTAILVSFGAPLWNDIVTLLFRLQKGRGKRNVTSEGGNHA